MIRDSIRQGKQGQCTRQIVWITGNLPSYITERERLNAELFTPARFQDIGLSIKRGCQQLRLMAQR